MTPAVQLQNHPDVHEPCIIFHSAAGKGGGGGRIGGRGGGERVGGRGGGGRGGCRISLQTVMLDGNVTQSERKLHLF